MGLVFNLNMSPFLSTVFEIDRKLISWNSIDILDIREYNITRILDIRE